MMHVIIARKAVPIVSAAASSTDRIIALMYGISSGLSLSLLRSMNLQRFYTIYFAIVDPPAYLESASTCRCQNFLPALQSDTYQIVC
jgi:hypothetical protein